jgi:hypothetical protein
MNIGTGPFYYFSFDQDSPLLPTRARFNRQLRPSGGDLLRECALIQLERFSESTYPFEYLIIIPRHGHTGLFGGGERVEFVNAFDGRSFLGKDTVDLSAPGLRLLDIAGIGFSEAEAHSWQVRA